MKHISKILLMIFGCCLWFSCGTEHESSGEARDWRKYNDSLKKALNDSLDALPVPVKK